MKLFGFLKFPDINQGVEEFRFAGNAVLLDVRDVQEYEHGHIPGAINIPRDEIERAKEQIPDPETAIYAYSVQRRQSRGR